MLFPILWITLQVYFLWLRPHFTKWHNFLWIWLGSRECIFPQDGQALFRIITPINRIAHSPHALKLNVKPYRCLHSSWRPNSSSEIDPISTAQFHTCAPAVRQWVFDIFLIQLAPIFLNVDHLVSEGKIKCYRPFGKMLYFDREEVIEFLKRNPINGTENIAANYFLNSNK